MLWGLWYGKFTRGEYPEAVRAGEQLLELQQHDGDSGQLLEAHHSLWATLTAMGRSSAAMSHMQRGLALYDRHKHGSQAFVYGGHDPGACCRWHLALNQWLLGFPDRALSSLKEALSLAEELNHPLTTTIACYFAAAIHYERGDHVDVAAKVDRLMSVANAYGFQAWADVAIALPAGASGARLDRQSLAELERRLRSSLSTAWRRVVNFCVLAQLCANAGEPEVGRNVLAGISPSDRNALYASEIARIEGELMLKMDKSSATEAERCFQSAIHVARSRGEKSLELRAALSLARLWQRTGRREEAHRALSGIYNWFTEGFDTADLRSAREVLKELA